MKNKNKFINQCSKCIYFSYGKCFYHNATGIAARDVRYVFGILCNKCMCDNFVDRNTIKRNLPIALEMSKDAKVYNDKTVAECAIRRLALCRKIMFHSDIAMIDQEIHTLRTTFDIDVSKYLREEEIYHTQSEKTVPVPSV